MYFNRFAEVGILRNIKTNLCFVPAFQLRANTGEGFVIKLLSKTVEIWAVGKTVDGRLPRTVMDMSTLTADVKRKYLQSKHVHVQ